MLTNSFHGEEPNNNSLHRQQILVVVVVGLEQTAKKESAPSQEDYKQGVEQGCGFVEAAGEECG